MRRVSEARPIVPRLREVSHVVARPLLQTLRDLDAAVRPQLGGAHLQLRHDRAHHALALARTRDVVRSGEEREVLERLRCRRLLLLRLLRFRENGQGGGIVAVLAGAGRLGATRRRHPPHTPQLAPLGTAHRPSPVEGGVTGNVERGVVRPKV